MVMMDPRVIGAHIRMRKPSLTVLEHTVLDNIIARAEFTEDTPLKDIALENNVSEAMIVKIAKKLDFKGYREFRANLVRYRHHEVSGLFSEISSDDDINLLINKVFGNSIQALEETKALLKAENLNKCVEMLFAAGEILLYGTGGGAVIAADFSYKLLRIGIRASVICDTNNMLMSSAVCTPASVVLAISHSGRTRDVIDAVKLAGQNGAGVIVLTNYPSSPICKYADTVLCSTSQGSMFLGEDAAARIAMLNIIDVIFVALSQKNSPRAGDLIAKTNSAVKDRQVK